MFLTMYSTISALGTLQSALSSTSHGAGHTLRDKHRVNRFTYQIRSLQFHELGPNRP